MARARGWAAEGEGTDGSLPDRGGPRMSIPEDPHAPDPLEILPVSSPLAFNSPAFPQPPSEVRPSASPLLPSLSCCRWMPWRLFCLSVSSSSTSYFMANCLCGLSSPIRRAATALLFPSPLFAPSSYTNARNASSKFLSCLSIQHLPDDIPSLPCRSPTKGKKRQRMTR